MDQCDRVKGVNTPSKTPCLGHDTSTTQSPEQQQRPDSPAPSCLSMKSEGSMGIFQDFKAGQYDGGKIQTESVKQDNQEVPGVQSTQQRQTDYNSTFKQLEENGVTFLRNELKRYQMVLRNDYPQCLEREMEDSGVEDNKEEEQLKKEALLNFTLVSLRTMNQNDLADFLQSRVQGAMCRRKLKANQRKRFQYVSEGIAKAGKAKLLNDIYTELHITEGESDINNEHEVRQIEIANQRKQNRTETKIRCEDIFKPSPGRDRPIRTVMTKGVAGIGKTVLTQKFTLDWAEDKSNQDILFIFPFTFRELNVLKKKKLSLVQLLHDFFTETKEAQLCRFEQFKVVFIFDGLDECRFPLDFCNNEILTDVKESTSVDVLLTNLIRGNLLPSARLWITTRRAAANQIPPESVDVVTEVSGFTDPQKDKYFRKRFRDEQQASRIISHIKTSRSLHIMCHIPIFCWITAKVLKDVLKTREGRELPKTLTEMYIHFLVVQSKRKIIRYHGGAETDPPWTPETKEMIEALGKLAFEQLLKGNLIFYESDLTECGINIKAASLYSGVFTLIFEEVKGLYQVKLYCFVHLSVQEFLAALHVHLTFINSGRNLLSEGQTCSPIKKNSVLTDLHKIAVDQALQSPNGHLDLFLRFLVGLSLKTNQIHLHGLFTQTSSITRTYQGTAEYIKKKIKDDPSPEKSINLFHCLSELRNRSLVEEIQQYLSSGCLSTSKLSPDQWSALAFVLLSSESNLDLFELKKYSASEEALLRLLPVVKASNKVVLSGCNLTERSYAVLSEVITSDVKELDLSNNDLKDSGMEWFSVGLENTKCMLKTLRLCGCNLSERGCETLALVLRFQSSSLKELDLSNNDLWDSGVKQLSDGLRSLQCTLEILRLSGCLITEEGCSSLASALNTNPSHLKALDLSYNHPGDSGEKLLSAILEDPQYKLDTLRTDHGGRERLQPGMRKYACDLTLDQNTAHKNLRLSDNNRKVIAREEQPYPPHTDRFEFWCQVLCVNGLTERSYWEVRWRGHVHVAVTYREIRRKGLEDEGKLGKNDQSWSLRCSEDGFTVCHNERETKLSLSSCPISHRVAVYVDCPAGSLSFYSVSSDSLIHLHTINTTFTKPLYPAFALGSIYSSCSGSKLRAGSSLSLCSPTERAETSV